MEKKNSTESLSEKDNLANRFQILGSADTHGPCGADYLGISPIGEKWIRDYRRQGGTGHYTSAMKSLVLYTNTGLAKHPYGRIEIRERK